MHYIVTEKGFNLVAIRKENILKSCFGSCDEMYRLYEIV